MKKDYLSPRVKVVLVETQTSIMNPVSATIDETGED